MTDPDLSAASPPENAIAIVMALRTARHAFEGMTPSMRAETLKAQAVLAGEICAAAQDHGVPAWSAAKRAERARIAGQDNTHPKQQPTDEGQLPLEKEHDGNESP